MSSPVPFNRLIRAVLRPYWRMRRGLTLGAQGIVLDAERRVLLVRHGYLHGWHFPGGGVEWRETVEEALARELIEETGVELTGPARLLGLYSNFSRFPGDHVAVFVVEQWRRPSEPAPGFEIQETRFFTRAELPDDLSAGCLRRLQELDGSVRATGHW